MVTIDDLLGADELAKALEDGYVRRQSHPSLPLAILNYTERCTYDRAWTDVTRKCRGLIYSTATGEVVARPFEKFFNYGEDAEAVLSMDEQVAVTDKMDGSLGILYPVPDGWAIATRGSFTSEQAIHATAVLRDRYPDYEPPSGYTELFEIVYPKNRIVLDYGAADDLYYLGSVHVAKGWTFGPVADKSRPWCWPGPLAGTFRDVRSLADALAMEPRPNAEGIVVQYLGSGLRVKIKQADYVALHRLITGMNARVIWERIGDGQTADQICKGIPEEFWPWVREVIAELLAEQDQILNAAGAEHARVLAALPDGWTRKDYALAVASSSLRPWLFLLLDQRDPSAKIWHTLRPSGERTLVAYSEDTA